MLDHVLRLNMFDFNSDLFTQYVGTAMGTKAASTVANIFIAVIDTKIKECGIIKDTNCIHFHWRFIDKIFIIWT
jgi:hypothetical protein